MASTKRSLCVSRSNIASWVEAGWWRPRWSLPVPLSSSPDLASLGRCSGQSQFPCHALHGLNAKGDVLFQLHTKLGSSVDDVIPVDAAREGFVLHLLAYALRVHFSQGF